MIMTPSRSSFSFQPIAKRAKGKRFRALADINRKAIQKEREKQDKLRTLARANLQQSANQPFRARQVGISQFRSQTSPHIIDRTVGSSMAWRLRYNIDTLDFMVWWNKGGFGVYRKVPFSVAQRVFAGDATATSDGENEYGKFWKGKYPSVGAAIHTYLIDKFAYESLGATAARPKVRRMGGTSP